MSIFVSSSKNLTNIWAGIGAGLWAVSKSADRTFHAGRVTKSKSMKIGSFGILYCSDTQSLTTPFIVFSAPDEAAVVREIWPEEWVLPFAIHPLGSPRKQMPKSQAMELLPSLRDVGHTNFGKALPVQATTAFAASPLKDADWELLISHLAESFASTDFEALSGKVFADINLDDLP